MVRYRYLSHKLVSNKGEIYTKLTNHNEPSYWETNISKHNQILHNDGDPEPDPQHCNVTKTSKPKILYLQQEQQTCQHRQHRQHRQHNCQLKPL